MKKYKICVYAICKNEEKFVASWVESMKEADEIVVLDTGSTDNTVEELRKLGVKVEQQIFKPWRFDVARNESLKLVSSDMDFCVCVDLDERFKKGWRSELEKHLSDDVSRVSYRYTWNFNEDGSEGVVFFADKIHRNKMFVWEHPVHETLKQVDFSLNKQITIPTLQLNHYADTTKSRSSYLPLLELSVKEDPNSDRNVHYLGREYYFYGKYDKAIETLKHHLEMPNSVWDQERSASCRIIGSCYERLNQSKKAVRYFQQAISECPRVREPYIELAKFYFRKKNYLSAIVYLQSAINIQNRELTYMSQPECWNAFPYDLLALSYYHLKNYNKACFYGNIAITLSPNDKRLKDNQAFYLQKLNNLS